MLVMITNILEQYFFEERRRAQLIDSEQFNSMLIPLINVIHKSTKSNGVFIYQKKSISQVLKIFKLIIFNKEFIRENNVTEALIEFSESCINLLINTK
mmetsp:Transcript_6118/g.5475  ORF Transcript_6118/g.5475 Transcript_6118/m.5475 type:complete len:98 (+) Transcript_6118:23-316(+)